MTNKDGRHSFRRSRLPFGRRFCSVTVFEVEGHEWRGVESSIGDQPSWRPLILGLRPCLSFLLGRGCGIGCAGCCHDCMKFKKNVGKGNTKCLNTCHDHFLTYVMPFLFFLPLVRLHSHSPSTSVCVFGLPLSGSVASSRFLPTYDLSLVRFFVSIILCS